MSGRTDERFGEWLLVNRRRRGVSQGELGEKIEVTSSTISRIERDETHPTRAQAIALAAAVTDDPAEVNRALGLLGFASASADELPIQAGPLAPDEAEPLGVRDGNGAGGGPRDIGAVVQINRAYEYARSVLKAAGSRYDQEVPPPDDVVDSDGIQERLAFVRAVERQHDLRLLPEKIG